MNKKAQSTNNIRMSISSSVDLIIRFTPSRINESRSSSMASPEHCQKSDDKNIAVNGSLSNRLCRTNLSGLTKAITHSIRISGALFIPSQI
jgi:hypothetical protein